MNWCRRFLVLGLKFCRKAEKLKSLFLPRNRELWLRSSLILEPKLKPFSSTEFPDLMKRSRIKKTTTWAAMNRPTRSRSLQWKVHLIGQNLTKTARIRKIKSQQNSRATLSQVRLVIPLARNPKPLLVQNWKQSLNHLVALWRPFIHNRHQNL